MRLATGCRATKPLRQHVSARLPAPRSAGRWHGWCGGVAAALARARGGAGAHLTCWHRHGATRPGRDARSRRLRARLQGSSSRQRAFWRQEALGRRAAAERPGRPGRFGGAQAPHSLLDPDDACSEARAGRDDRYGRLECGGLGGGQVVGEARALRRGDELPGPRSAAPGPYRLP